MMRGRKPAPTPLKIMKGEQKSRINMDAPAPPPGRPERPKDLDPKARAEWDRVIPLLEEMRVISRVDGAALAVYCRAYSTWRKACADIDENGLFSETVLGGVKPNPAVAMQIQAGAQMARVLVEFGATPSSRSRLTAPADRAQDELGAFLGPRKVRSKSR
jgi:P27 family predicted phage terminase small subunit